MTEILATTIRSKAPVNPLFVPPEGEPRADPCPDLIGNDGLKELILCALCGLDVNYVRETAVPIIVVGKSGGGKSTMMEGIKKTFSSFADIYGVDSLTPAQIKGMAKGTGKTKRVVKYQLATLSLFDEINKWQMNYLEGVIIPAFGAEMGVRVREGEAIDTSDWKCLPMGTLLPYWLDFAGQGTEANKRVHNIEQIMRRSIILKLEDLDRNEELLGQFIDSAAAKLFRNIKYDAGVDLKKNMSQVVRVLANAQKALGLGKYRTAGEFLTNNRVIWASQKDYDAAKARLLNLAPLIHLSDRTVYDRQFTFNVFKLARGMAGRYGRSVVTADDVMRVCSILESHAAGLQRLWIRCAHCQIPIDPAVTKCPNCKKTNEGGTEGTPRSDSFA